MVDACLTVQTRCPNLNRLNTNNETYPRRYTPTRTTSSCSSSSACVQGPLDWFTSHVGEHRTVRGLWKRQGIPCFFKIPTVQQSPEEDRPFVYIMLATLVTMATGGYTPCLFGYVTIALARHDRTHFSQSERLLVKPKRPCTDLCAEPVGVWNILRARSRRHRAAHVESQIVPLFSESLTIRAIDSVLNNARRRYEKCIVLGR